MRKVVLFSLLVLAGFSVWWLFIRSGATADEDKIKALCGKLTEACGKSSEESPVAMAMKNSRIANLVSDPCSVSIREATIDGTFSPMAFASQITKGRAGFKSLRGEVEDLTIKVAPDGENAVADYSIRLSGVTKAGGAFDESRDLHSKLRKVDGVWKFSSFEINRVLER